MLTNIRPIGSGAQAKASFSRLYAGQRMYAANNAAWNYVQQSSESQRASLTIFDKSLSLDSKSSIAWLTEFILTLGMFGNEAENVIRHARDLDPTDSASAYDGYVEVLTEIEEISQELYARLWPVFQFEEDLALVPTTVKTLSVPTKEDKAIFLGQSGQMRWELPKLAKYNSAQKIIHKDPHGDIAICFTEDEICAIKANTIVWKKVLSDEKWIFGNHHLSEKIALYNSKLFFSQNNNAFTCLSVLDGTLVWEQDSNIIFPLRILFKNGSIFVLGSGPYHRNKHCYIISALETNNGQKHWERQFMWDESPYSEHYIQSFRFPQKELDQLEIILREVYSRSGYMKGNLNYRKGEMRLRIRIESLLGNLVSSHIKVRQFPLSSFTNIEFELPYWLQKWQQFDGVSEKLFD
ncbi:MAG: hypothetical protein HQ564_08935 [Candidatus Saganbacteria bacterium]|nr:hypothetical protein [Candidatus Saganbacteria bacterium]